MTDPFQRPARMRPLRLAAGAIATAALLHISTASASPAGDDFAAHFAAFDEPAEPAPVAGAVDLDALGQDDAPSVAERLIGEGMASYYGAELAGRRTASGERFDPRDLTAAHRTLPFGSKVRVTNPANGRSVVVRINDRGPFSRGRLIDLSRSAAEQIGLVARGHGTVELALIDG